MSILIVDDNEVFLDTLLLLLKESGLTATTCTAADCALDLLKERSFSVFIVDYNLFGMKGDRLASEIRQHEPAALIIGCSIEFKEQAFLASGADRFILKENLPNELVPSINEFTSSKESG